MNQLYDKKRMLIVLLELKKDGPARKKSGICQNASELYESYYGVFVPVEAMQDLMSQWPEFSGNELFPVPSPWGGDSGFAYRSISVDNFWNPLHSYGAARLRLLDWLIEQLS